MRFPLPTHGQAEAFPSPWAVLLTVSHGSELCVLASGHLFSDRWVYHLSGGLSFPAPPRSLLGWAKITCHIAMASCSGSPSGGWGGLLLPWLVSSNAEGQGLQLDSWWQGWQRDMCHFPSL